MSNPLKTYWFYIGVAVGLAVWLGVWIPEFLMKLMLNLPGYVFVILYVMFIVFFVMSRFSATAIGVLAKGDKNNFGRWVSAGFVGSGHSLLGLGSVGLINYFFTFIAGSNLHLFFLCSLTAFTFYWYARDVRSLVAEQKIYSKFNYNFWQK